jgi:hypothetical protein
VETASQVRGRFATSGQQFKFPPPQFFFLKKSSVQRLFLIIPLILFTSVANAQRGGEVTVTITPPALIKSEAGHFVAEGEHRLHFRNTTSRDAKILSMELLFLDQPDTTRNCDNFFGNTIGAAARRYDLKDISVPSAKTATATTKMLPPEKDAVFRVEPNLEDRAQRVTIIACYKFTFELDGAPLEVNSLAGRWVFNRRTGALVSKTLPAKNAHELLPH